MEERIIITKNNEMSAGKMKLEGDWSMYEVFSYLSSSLVAAIRDMHAFHAEAAKVLAAKLINEIEKTIEGE